MARTANYTLSQREAAQRIPDTDVATVPEVVAARGALADAEKAYSAAVAPRKAILHQLEELRAERAKA